MLEKLDGEHHRVQMEKKKAPSKAYYFQLKKTQEMSRNTENFLKIFQFQLTYIDFRYKL